MIVPPQRVTTAGIVAGGRGQRRVQIEGFLGLRAKSFGYGMRGSAGDSSAGAVRRSDRIESPAALTHAQGPASPGDVGAADRAGGTARMAGCQPLARQRPGE